MRFTLNGEQLELLPEDVQRRLRDVSPEPVRRYGVNVGSGFYPVKQAFEAATGIPRSRFTTQVARRHLAALGFEPVATDHQHLTVTTSAERAFSSERPRADTAEPFADNGDWHTEARVQAMVMTHLEHRGWTIKSFADTASREPGIDIVAERGTDLLAIEVKGFPGRSYADPRRKDEKKRARPSTQAKGWYGRAVLAAMLTRSHMPQARSVIALPDFPRYRDLFRDTAESLQKCGIEVWWVGKEGGVTPWTGRNR
jgi:hypothetical protein